MSKFTVSPPAWMQSGSGESSASGGVNLMNLSASVGIDANDFSTGIASIQTSMTQLNTSITDMLGLIKDIAVNTQSTLMLLSADASSAAVAIAAAVEGATDEEIANVQAEMATLRETYGETADAAGDIADATDEIDESVSRSSFSFEGLASKARAAASAIKNVAVGIWNVGKSLVESAASRDISERQFASLFAGMEDTASDTLQRLSENTGLYYTTIRSNMAKAFLQFKSVGMDETEALASTASAINMAADAAAMYGLSMDDATQRLLSFMRGNLEAGEAIGLFAGIGERNSIAAQLFDGAEWKDLDEIQRQTALLQLAYRTYANANVHGKSAEYADSYAISLQNLQARIENLKATLGAPIMDAITPVFENISAWINANPDKVQALAEAIGTLAESLASLAMDAIDAIAENPEILTGILDTIGAIASALGSLVELLGPIVAWLGEKLGIIGGGISSFLEDPAGTTAQVISDVFSAPTMEGADSWLLGYQYLSAYDALKKAETEGRGVTTARARFETVRNEFTHGLTKEQQDALTNYIWSLEYVKNEQGEFTNRRYKYTEGKYLWGADTILDQLFGDFDVSDFAEISGKLDALPDAFSQSVAAALSGIGVYMDGQVVGHLVAPTVMGDMARNARNSTNT